MDNNFKDKLFLNPNIGSKIEEEEKIQISNYCFKHKKQCKYKKKK